MSREHEASPECWCGPRPDVEDGVWIHNEVFMSNSDMVKFDDLEKRVAALEEIVEGLADSVRGKVVHDEVLGQPVDPKKREQLRNTLEQSRGPSASRPT